MANKLYDDFMDAQTGFSGIFKLRTISPAQIEFRQKLIDNKAVPHKVKQWPIKDKKEGGNWPNDALPPFPDPMQRFIDGEINPAYLTNEAWEELFKDFAKALREMNRNKTRLSLEPTVEKFIKDYFPIFGGWNLTATADLDALINYIERDTSVQDELIAGASVGMAWSAKPFSKRSELNKFLREIKDARSSGIYSEEIKDTLINVANSIESSATPMPAYNGMPATPPALTLPNGLDLDRLKNSLDTEDVSAKLSNFKGKFVEIYSKLYTLPKVKNAFGATSTGSGIVSYMKEAEEIYDFNKKDSENFIDEKIKDELDPIAAFQKTFNDKTTEHLGRLKRRHDGWPYKNPQAEAIVEAMYKEGFTSQQGLGWILTNKDKVITRLGAGHESIGRFKWMCDQLELSKSKQKVAFRDALYNGQKLKAIKEEMKINAPKTGATAKYKVTSEVLTVIQYEDFTTFNDKEFWKNKFDPFKDASFMKNDAIKIVANAATGAFNLGLKFGSRAVKVGIRKANKFIAANSKTKRLSALEARLESDRDKNQSVLTSFGPAVNAMTDSIKIKEEEKSTYQKEIDEINATDNGKKLIELNKKQAKIYENLDAINDAIIQLNTQIPLAITPEEAARTTRERDNIITQLGNYITANGVGITIPYTPGPPPVPGTYTTNFDTDIALLDAAIAPLLARPKAGVTAVDADLATLNATLDGHLNAGGFDRWDYDQAKYLADNAQGRIDDIAEMNSFDKELEATSRSLNILKNIETQRKEWYADQAVR